MNPRNPIPVWLMHCTFVATAILCSTPLRARSAPLPDPVQALKVYLERATTGLPGRVEISVGALDERIKLAPCAQVEPYIPQGARLWGRSSIGLRCMDAPGWNVFLPVDIKVYGVALVATRALFPGDNPGQPDVREQEVELTRESGMVVSQISQLEGKTTARMVSAGQILKQDFFRAPPAVGAGDAVQLVYNGAGFSILTGGRALSNAAEGQQVRVQTESGRVVQGIARLGRQVDMK